MQYERCLESRSSFEFRLPSKSRPGEFHVVTGAFSVGAMRCDCKAFRFRGTCSHTNVHREACGWDSRNIESEKQTEDQQKRHECPACGGRTETVLEGFSAGWRSF